MQEVCIISYQLNTCSSAQKTAIQRALNGHVDYSNNGIYTYKRKGLLEEMPHKIVGKGVILISPKDKKKVAFLLKKNKAGYKSLILTSKKKILA